MIKFTIEKDNLKEKYKSSMKNLNRANFLIKN